MPRRPRIFVENGFYHLILRGNSRTALFRDERDRHSFQSLVIEGLQRYGCQLHAYCWMTNHIHAIVRISDRPLGHYVRWLGTQYARGFNRRYGRTGHVFERRHRAIFVKDDAQLLALIRYVHLNPVEARMVSDPAAYQWSSHGAYLGRTGQPEWLQTRFILELFAADVSLARRHYASFVAADIGSAEKHALDRACFPTDNQPAGDTERRASNARLDTYFRGELGIASELLATIRKPGRRRDHARLRASISASAIEDDVATLTELANYFVRSVAAMSRTIARYRQGQRDQ